MIRDTEQGTLCGLSEVRWVQWVTSRSSPAAETLLHAEQVHLIYYKWKWKQYWSSRRIKNMRGMDMIQNN